MTESTLHQEITKRVRDINSLLKAYARESAPNPKQRVRRCKQPGTPHARLLECCAETFGAAPAKIMSNSRENELSLARHMYYYIRYRHHGIQPSQELGEELGRHRTTACHSIKKAADLLVVDRNFRKKYEEILSELKKDTPAEEPAPGAS
jgi:chromosomal replication initiation ATPase DnaA